jgi:hypothetical protein
MGEGHSPRRIGQLAELGQHRLQEESWQDHSRHLLDRTQPLQGHATRYFKKINLLKKNSFFKIHFSLKIKAITRRGPSIGLLPRP